jgi:heme exporter protein D
MNWSEFFRMGGYGFYVWGSYLVAFILMAGEVALIIKRGKNLRQPDRRN